MKIYTLPVLILALAAASCKKDNSVSPSPQPASLSGTTTNGSSKLKNGPDTTKNAVNFKVNTQTVKTSVKDSTLTLLYTENVNLVLNEADYYSAWSVHLQDDFSKSALQNFDYTTVNSSGMTTLNWVDDNLNNIVNKSVADTVINNIKMVRVNVGRKYTFFKTYKDDGTAVAAQNAVLSKQGDVVSYTANYYMPSGLTKSYSTSVNITYTK